VRRLIVENVREFAKWGPLDGNGRPVKGKEGSIFRAFLHAIRSLGYTVDWQILNCADYGDATTRRRFFLQAVKGRKKIAWPSPTHLEHGDNIFGLPKWRSAREIIDWSLRGESIFNRKRPLAASTLRRIEHGINRYWKPYAEPFLILLRGTGRSRAVDKPLPAVTTSGHHAALVEPFLINNYGHEPLQTITDSRGGGALIEPFLVNVCHGGHSHRVREIGKPVAAILTKNSHGLLEPFLVKYYGTGTTESIDIPPGTLTPKEKFALIEPGVEFALDIRFRMLQPHELAAAQSLPGNYRLCGTKTEIMKQIGNAVPVKTAKKLSQAAILQCLEDIVTYIGEISPFVGEV
jgi:DNA (cytosine-5)-methyltransferase 1